ncbi:hypothetical protein HMPREF9244_00791 [Alloscardovia omnicolens F0580]|uniref:Uncharacterized protein n=1 Tax=Alloscardovia omnicolens F0580 TaxID=1321816 RepID=U1SFY8_9BIFI|nr:hypothetical protein HMPREF9244_00791 [Alloscardovia omnicolens F0580]
MLLEYKNFNVEYRGLEQIGKKKRQPRISIDTQHKGVSRE